MLIRARALYERRPLTFSVALALLCLAALYAPAVLGLRVLPYDFQTDYYPWYVDALRAFWVSPFELFDPYKLGGIYSFPLLASYDPIDALPALFGAIPDLIGYQDLLLAHLGFIPLGLGLVLRARAAPAGAYLALVPVSIAACGLGPELKYIEWAKPVEAYAYGFLVLGALEMLRATLRLRYAVLLGCAWAFAFVYFPESGIFWPFVVLPYVVVHRAAFFNRRGLACVATACAIAAVLVLPSALVSLKVFTSIQVTENVKVLASLVPVEALAFAGVPLGSLSLVSVPFALGALALLAFRTLSHGERVFYGTFVAVAAVYSFSTLTPLAAIVRAVFPIARASRRPDAILYVLLPVLAYLALRGLAGSPRIGARAAAIAVAAFGVCALLAGALHASSWVSLAAMAVAVLPLAAMRTAAWWSAGLIAQWLLLCFVPFWQSTWAPQAYDATASYFGPYRSLAAYLPFHTDRTARAYRVLSAGLPANFGSYAPVFEYYNVAGDYSVIFPRELIRRSGINDLHAATIALALEQSPERVGGSGLRSLAVKYYIFSPEVYAALRGDLRRRRGLVKVDAPGYWQIVRDDRAQPFAVADFPDGARGPVDGRMGRSWVTFSPPAGAADVRFSFTYDPWWHVRVGGRQDDRRRYDAQGQLAVDTAGLGPSPVTISYGDRGVQLALALVLAAYAAFAAAGAALLGGSIVAARRRGRLSWPAGRSLGRIGRR